MDIVYPIIDFTVADKNSLSIDRALEAITPSHERPYVVYSPRVIRPSWAQYFASASATFLRSHDHVSASLADTISRRITRSLTDPHQRQALSGGRRVCRLHSPGLNIEPASVKAAVAALIDQLAAVPPERQARSFPTTVRALNELSKRITTE
jgi:hypothetical protein